MPETRVQLDARWIIVGHAQGADLVELAVVGQSDSKRGAHAIKPENLGAVREKTVGYYGSVSDACLAYLTKHAEGGSGAQTAHDLIAAYHDCVLTIVSKLPDLRLAAQNREAANGAQQTSPAD